MELDYPYNDNCEGVVKFIVRNPTTNFIAERGGEIVGAIMAGHDVRSILESPRFYSKNRPNAPQQENYEAEAH
ncbi:MAG: hypothetical protein LBU32_16260 [Clostridiales bacterium]|nr:hypothetical protein [Clostridiales bacterium]